MFFLSFVQIFIKLCKYNFDALPRFFCLAIFVSDYGKRIRLFTDLILGMFWSTTQKNVTLSSRRKKPSKKFADSRGALGFVERRGSGNVRHVQNGIFLVSREV